MASSVSTSVRIRFPREMLAAIEDWAAAHNLERSPAVRALVLRSLVRGQPKCNCDGQPDACSGNCK